MQEHEERNADMEQRTEQETAETEREMTETEQKMTKTGLETAEAVLKETETEQKINRKEQKMAKNKGKNSRKSRQEREKNGNEPKTGFWNSIKFQNAVFMTGLLVMTVSIVWALLFLFTMDIDDELSYYGLESVLEETLMTSDYTDSCLFEDAYMEEAVTQAEAAQVRALFETDGKFDENKTIDLAYVSMLRGKAVSATGITYRIGDLLSVRNTDIDLRWLIQPQIDAVHDKKKEDPAAVSSWEELNEILMESMTADGVNYPQKRCVYFEEVFPTDGESLYIHAENLDMLAIYTEYLEELIPFVSGMYDKYARVADKPCNIGIALVCPSIGLTYCGFADYEGVREGSFAEISEALYDYVAQKEHGVVYHCGAGTIFDGSADISLFEEKLGRMIDLHEGDRLYLVLDAEFSQNDSLRRMKDWYETIKITAERLIAVFIIGMILFLIGFVRRTMLEGRSEAQKPRLIDRWFTSILLAVIGLMLVSAIIPLELLEVLGEWYWGYYDSGNTVGIYMNGGGILLVSVLSVFVIASVVSYCFFELVNRLKKRTTYKKSLLRFVLCKCRKAVLWVFRCVQKLLMLVDGKIKWAVGYVLFLFVNLLAVLFTDESFVPFVLMAIADLFIGALVIAYFREQDKLREHMEATVQGSRGEPLAADRFHGKNKKTAELINDMDTGISRAVEKSMKDERMRTELIANVSHDIRTPLTSIINYVDLLKKEPIESENAQKYLGVLDEKSSRLKQLTEDLVEASRITSGNVSVENVRLSAAELVQQIAAEYEEKFKQKDLTLVLQLPEEQADNSFIGDSRYVWRVLSNLFSNLYKYAMPHTRVYFSMYRTPTPTFCMELKNISEYPLNISPEELTERFVRGDASRGTEGNGLGLSIAQSLMNVMHGSLEILIDGDLFKVLLHFPVPSR
ncbi:MAG: hypothetical protein HDQ98_02080 [Lachnospiraceae bacterium]|nr:hypothetical protein [Lachnospiraceae bacterium]